MGMFRDVKTLRHPYYIVNLMLSASFLLCKLVPQLCSLVFAGDCEIDMRQTEILFMLIVVVMFRARKTGPVTLVSFVRNSFIYCKTANTFLWLYAYHPYGLFFLFLILLQFVLVPQPTYYGPQAVTYFRDIKSFNEETNKKNITWIVEFYSEYVPSRVKFSSVIFAELSAKYSLENLKFGTIDLSKIPELATKYYVTKMSFSTQLPNVLLFENGKLKYSWGKPKQIPGKEEMITFMFSQKMVIDAFNLNNLYADRKKELEARSKIAKSSGHAKSD